jgi:radical SAM protein with 4Fe4S-binding SPASM domain
MIYAERSKWALECPCKNKDLTISKESDIDIEACIAKKEITGEFYIDKKGPYYYQGNLFFKKNDNYAGPLILNSPLGVYLEITEKCNLNCIGCYLNKNDKEGQINHLENIVNDLSKSGVVNVQLLGGEPTTFPKLSELCAYIKSKDMQAEIVSNGYCIPDSLIKNLDKKVDLFCISIDGNRKTHNYLRANNQSYDLAVSSLKKLASTGFKTEVVMTLNKLNYKQIKHVQNLCKGISDFYIKMFIPSNNKNRELSLSRENLRDVKKICENLKIDNTSFAAGFGKQGEYSFFGCPMGKTNALIDINGNVFNCAYNRRDNNYLGNVFGESFENIWSRNNKNILENLPKKCITCKFQSRCGGLCNVKATQ